jgi:hypothetical protein
VGELLCRAVGLGFHRKGAENAKKRDFSFAVEMTAKEKNQSLRDIFGPKIPAGCISYRFASFLPR